ncbi:MAG: hypothetical protein R3A80_12150 [Bdellovibrionota bacterium]
MSRHSPFLLDFNKLLGLGLCLLSANIEAKHPAHQSDDTPFTVIGGFKLNPSVISENNPGLKVNRYGTTTLLQQGNDGEASPGPLLDPLTKKEIVIRDQHYKLYNFQKQPLNQWIQGERESLGYGIRIIPAAPGFQSPEAEKSGNLTIQGSKTVDEYLRKVVYGYTDPADRRHTAETIKAQQPIFAQIAYLHPEGFQGEPFSLANEPNLKTEMGFTHKGLYLGDGKTVNSPPYYHGDTWWDEGQANYPAFLSVIDFSGFSDGTNFNVKEFNKNGIMSAMVLNETAGGAHFPREFDYKFDPVYSVTLEKILDFYARWLEDDPIFGIEDPNDPRYMESQFYKTYCAEHATDITNVTINLPQNLTGYKEVYGERDGERLFELAMDKIYNSRSLRSGAEAIYIRDTYLGKGSEERRRKIGEGLTPYWQVLEKDLPANQKTKQVVFKDARSGKYLAKNPKFKEIGYSLAWQPETVADLLKDFIRAYLPWPRVGSLTSVAAMIGFSSEAKLRMNIDVLQYIKTISPIVQQIFLHEAAMEIGLAKLSGVSDEGALFERFTTARSARTKALRSLMANIVIKMQSAERGDAQVDPKIANQINNVSKDFMALIDGAGSIEQDKGWQRTIALNNKSLAGRNFAGPQGLVDYRDSIYDNNFAPTVAPMLTALNKIDPNPTPELTVKYYFAPAVHVRVAMGIHDADSPTRQHLRLYPVGHVIQANETLPVDGHTKATIDDNISFNLKVL